MKENSWKGIGFKFLKKERTKTKKGRTDEKEIRERNGKKMIWKVNKKKNNEK